MKFSDLAKVYYSVRFGRGGAVQLSPRENFSSNNGTRFRKAAEWRRAALRSGSAGCGTVLNTADRLPANQQHFFARTTRPVWPQRSRQGWRRCFVCVLPVGTESSTKDEETGLIDIRRTGPARASGACGNGGWAHLHFKKHPPSGPAPRQSGAGRRRAHDLRAQADADRVLLGMPQAGKIPTFSWLPVIQRGAKIADTRSRTLHPIGCRGVITPNSHGDSPA